MNFKKQIFSMAKQDPKTLVFPEASFSDSIMSAVKIITSKKLAKVILLGDPNVFFVKYNSFENNYLKIIDPKTSELKSEIAQKFLELKFNDSLTQESAEKLAEDNYYFASALLLLNYADGIVSGSESISSKTYLPVFNIFNEELKDKTQSSGVLLIGKNKFLKNRSLLISDCTLNVNPSSSEVVGIAKNCIDFWKMLFLQEPKVAFLSYLTNSDDKSENVLKMRKATQSFQKEYPDVICDGEMQLDCAIWSNSQRKKFADCKIKGDANILIVPDITTGNCLAKALEYVGGLQAVGSISFGFNKPVSVVSRNATIQEIVLTSVITSIQAQV